ncbi:M20 family metallopeptidase [soil metagenome]
MTAQTVLPRLRAATEAMVADLEALVMHETPSEDLDAVRSGCAAFANLIARRLGTRPDIVEREGRPHVLLRTGASPRVLLLGHLDTVWPRGTTARWPFTRDGDHASGPGTFDMKAGLVQGLHAIGAGVDLDDVALLVTTDEEIGAGTSQALIEQQAAGMAAVLVLEPSAAGALKTARKGVSAYVLEVTGRASHAGLEPEAGVNALLELADHLPVIAAMGDSDAGTSVSPTRATAGTTMNTIPARATADVDVRAWTVAEQQRVDELLRGLRAQRPGARLTLHGGINRPPLEAAMSAGLFDLATECAARLGLVAPTGAAVGGGSDGNFTAALGIPTLDGLGPVGDGAHAEGEHILVSAMAERAALVHLMVTALVDG